MKDQEIVDLQEAYKQVCETAHMVGPVEMERNPYADKTGKPHTWESRRKKLEDEKKKVRGEEFETWVNGLVEEGYDLSEYTWDDMYEIYMEEVEQLDEFLGTGTVMAPRGSVAGFRTKFLGMNVPGSWKPAAGGATYSQSAADRYNRLNPTRSLVKDTNTNKFTSVAKPQPTSASTPKTKPTVPGTGGSGFGQQTLGGAQQRRLQQMRQAGVSDHYEPEGEILDEAPKGLPYGPVGKGFKKIPAGKKRNKMMQREKEYTRAAMDDASREGEAVGDNREKMGRIGGALRNPRLREGVDFFDTILEHLVAEGYADTNEAALVIMANMSEEWRQSIVEDFPNVLNFPRQGGSRSGDAGTRGLTKTPTGYINRHSGGEDLPPGTVNKIMGGHLMVKNQNSKSNVKTA